jgi:hypothetical protein
MDIVYKLFSIAANARGLQDRGCTTLSAGTHSNTKALAPWQILKTLLRG